MQSLKANEVFHAGYYFVYVYMTGERVTPESAENGDAEERGWVDSGWSKRELYDSRNDVKPVAVFDRSEFPGGLNDDGQTLSEALTETLAHELGAYEDNCDGTFYGSDEDTDYRTGDTWTYALHIEAADHMSRYPNVRTVDVTL